MLGRNEGTEEWFDQLIRKGEQSPSLYLKVTALLESEQVAHTEDCETLLALFCRSDPRVVGFTPLPILQEPFGQLAGNHELAG